MMTNEKIMNVPKNEFNLREGSISNDSKISNMLTDALNNLPNNKKYSPNVIKIIRDSFNDYSSPRFSIVKKVIYDIFENGLYNPFNIKQKIFNSVHDFCNVFLNPTHEDLLLYFESSEKYVNSKNDDLIKMLNKYFNDGDKNEANKIIEDKFRNTLNNQFILWDKKYDILINKNKLIDEFWKKIKDIAYFNVSESNKLFKEMNSISNNLKSFVNYNYKLTKEQFNIKVNNYIKDLNEYKINSKINNQNSDLYALIKETRDSLIKNEISNLKISKIKKNEIDKYMKEQNMNIFKNIFPGVHRIIFKYGLTASEINFMKPISSNGNPIYISNIGATENINGKQVTVFVIPKIEADESLSLIEQAERQINKEIATKSATSYNVFTEMLIHNIFNIQADDFVKLFKNDGFDVGIDKINHIIGSPLDFDPNQLNNLDGYNNKLELSNELKLKIINKKIYGYIYLKSINKLSGKTIEKRSFKLDFNINYLDTMEYFRQQLNKLANNLYIDDNLFFDQFLDNDNRLIDSMNKYGVDLFLKKYTNYEQAIVNLDQNINSFNSYRSDISYKIETSFVNGKLNMTFIIKDNIFDKKPNDPRSRGISNIMVTPIDLNVYTFPYMGNYKPISEYKSLSDEPYFSIFNYLIPKITSHPANHKLNLGDVVPDDYMIKISYLPKTLANVKEFITNTKYDILSESNYISNADKGNGVDIEFGKQIYSFIDKKNDRLIKFNAFIKLNFEKATQEYIDSGLKQIIDSLPDKNKNNKYAISQITEMYNKWIYDQKNNNYFYYVARKDIDNKLSELLNYEGELESNNDLVEKVKKVFEPKSIPNSTKELLENSINFTSLGIIASQFKSIDTDLLRKVLQNKELISKVNSMSMDQIKTFINTLDKTKTATKYSYFGIGVGLASIAMASIGSSVYMVRAGTKKKQVISKIKTSNFIKITTFLFALFAAAGSVITLLLFFIEKGGF